MSQQKFNYTQMISFNKFLIIIYMADVVNNIHLVKPQVYSSCSIHVDPTTTLFIISINNYFPV